MTEYVIGRRDEFPTGRGVAVQAGRLTVAIFRVGDEFFALNNRCPHRGGSLYHGIQTGLVESREPGRYAYSRKGEMVKCPWHGWEFDMRTGQSWCDPARVRARRYAVSVEAGTQLVAGPYVAETVPVTVEGDYVVIEA